MSNEEPRTQHGVSLPSGSAARGSRSWPHAWGSKANAGRLRAGPPTSLVAAPRPRSSPGAFSPTSVYWHRPDPAARWRARPAPHRCIDSSSPSPGLQPPPARPLPPQLHACECLQLMPTHALNHTAVLRCAAQNAWAASGGPQRAPAAALSWRSECMATVLGPVCMLGWQRSWAFYCTAAAAKSPPLPPCRPPPPCTTAPTGTCLAGCMPLSLVARGICPNNIAASEQRLCAARVSRVSESDRLPVCLVSPLQTFQDVQQSRGARILIHTAVFVTSRASYSLQCLAKPPECSPLDLGAPSVGALATRCSRCSSK